MKAEEVQTCEALLAVLGRLKFALSTAADAHDLTLSQMHTMYNIWHGANTMGQLAGSVHCDASTATGMVDRLIAQDLVTRESCESDRRTKLLSLTTKGQKIMDNIMVDLPALCGCAQFSDDEQQTLRALLKRVAVA